MTFAKHTLTAAFALGTTITALQAETIKQAWYSDWNSAKYAEAFDHLEYVNPEAPKGGTITLGTVGTFDSLNPYATGVGTPAVGSSLPYERLMAGVADEYQASYYCLLCEDLEYPESKDWVIFNLRKDVTFSDGSPMTAEDVVFTHEKFLAEGTPSWRAGVSAMIQSVEALDDHTVKFTFQPDIPRGGLIGQAGATIVMQKAWFDETGATLNERRYETAPGTGPYMIGDYEAGQWIEYNRNPDYWGAAHPMMVGRSNFDTIRYSYYGDTVAAFEAFKAGDITFRQENSSLQWSTAYDFTALDEGWVTKSTLPNGAMPNATGFLFNLRKDKFQDRDVRRALGMMYNFTWTNATLQYGLFEQRVSYWDAPGLRAEGLPDAQELAVLEQVRDLIPADLLTSEPLMPHVSGERSLDRKNLRAALALLEGAGWTPGEDGLLRDETGETLKVEILHYLPTWDRIINPYIENLTALGVDAVYTRVDPNEYQARTQSFEYDIIYSGYASGFEEGAGFGQKYGCDGVDDIFNPAGYCSEAIDKLAELVVAAESYDEMRAVVRAADRILRHEYFIVPAHMLKSHWVAYYDMYEHPENLPPLALGVLDFWWQNADKAADLQAKGALN